MLLPGREWQEGYRFGFNGKECFSDTQNDIDLFDFGYRIYNSSLARWWKLDPINKPNLSGYQFASNCPILFADPDGMDEVHFYIARPEIGWNNVGDIVHRVYIDYEIVKDGKEDISFFVHNNGISTQIYPFVQNSRIANEDSYQAILNNLPLSGRVESSLFTGAPEDDNVYLGRLVSILPDLKENYYGTDWYTAFNGATKRANSYDFGQFVVTANETVTAIVDGYIFLRALSAVLLEPVIINLSKAASAIQSGKTLTIGARGAASEFRNVQGVYVHEFASGKVYVGQGKNLARRSQRSLKELMDTSGRHKGTAAGDRYLKTNFIKLEGSGYNTLNELESAILKEYGGVKSVDNYNIRTIPK